MALKPDRKVTDGTDISYFMNVTAEKGSVVVLSTAGSGASMDDANALASLPTKTFGSGEYPLGILLCDVVSGDLTKTHLNQHKDEVQVGSKVTILRKGWITTNMFEGTPAGGQAAYISTAGTDGKVTGVAMGATGPIAIVPTLMSGVGGTAAGYPTTAPYCTKIGTFMSSKDADGYAKLEVNLI